MGNMHAPASRMVDGFNDVALALLALTLSLSLSLSLTLSPSLSLSLSPSLPLSHNRSLSLSLLRLQSLLALYKAMHAPAGFHARAEDRCMSSACAVCIRMP